MKGTTAAKKEIPTSDLTELLKPYQSGWVALSEDECRVVGAGDTLRIARAQAMDQGVPNAVFVKVIAPGEGYISHFL